MCSSDLILFSAVYLVITVFMVGILLRIARRRRERLAVEVAGD